jgi:filamentous hemagglutinin family protein
LYTEKVFKGDIFMRLFCALVCISKGLFLFANPQGFEAVTGEAACFYPDAQTLEVVTGKQAILEWHSFSIEEGETTRFVMPDHNSSVLNRVKGGDLSRILGSLESNGQVYLINPKGILVGEGAVVDTASFIASSFDILNEDFLKGNNIFCQGVDGSVINLGSITASDGAVRLIGNEVKLEGTIVALKTEERNGRTFLLGGAVHLHGNEVSLGQTAYVRASGVDGGGSVVIGGDHQDPDPESFNALIVNIDKEARIEADALLNGDGGYVSIWADVNSFYGTIFVRGGALSGNGGFAEVCSKGLLGYYGLTNTLAPCGTKGTLLLDPSTITISALPTSPNIGFGGICGSDTYCSKNDADANLNNSGLSDQLLLSNVVVYSTGDVNILANIYGPSDLTITAGGDVNILGASNMAGLIEINTGGLFINAVGSVNVQGGSTDLAFINLKANTVSISGETISLAGGEGTLSFVNVTAYSGGMTLTAASDIILQGSNNGTVSEVVLNTINGPIAMRSTSGSIYCNAGSRIGSGAYITSGGDLDIHANLQLAIVSTSSSAASLSGNGNATISATTMNMSGESPAYSAAIKNSSGDFAITANDVNLSSNASVVLLPGGFGNFNLSTTGDLFIANNSFITNQGAGSSMNIEAQGTVTLEASLGDVEIANYTANFSLITHADLIMTASSNGFSNITSSAPMNVISADNRIALTGSPMNSQPASMIFNNGTLNMQAGESLSFADYSLIKLNSNGAAASNMVLMAERGSCSLQGSFIYQYGGDLSILAGDSISFDSASFVSSKGNVALVVDNNFSTPPEIGPGAFVYPNGASLSAGNGKTMRIYTAMQGQNMMGSAARINGLTYKPSLEFVDTNQEFWGVYDPEVPAPTPSAPDPDGSFHFTIYYKNG